MCFVVISESCRDSAQAPRRLDRARGGHCAWSLTSSCILTSLMLHSRINIMVGIAWVRQATRCTRPADTSTGQCGHVKWGDALGQTGFGSSFGGTLIAPGLWASWLNRCQAHLWVLPSGCGHGRWPGACGHVESEHIYMACRRCRHVHMCFGHTYIYKGVAWERHSAKCGQGEGRMPAWLWSGVASGQRDAACRRQSGDGGEASAPTPGGLKDGSVRSRQCCSWRNRAGARLWRYR